MSIYLSEMSLRLKEQNVLVVMDGTGWHKAKNLVVRYNIKIIYLPGYPPELNPKEKLWQFMKDAILKNKIYDSIDVLEKTVIKFINNIDSSTIKSVRNVNYLPRYL